MRSDTFTMRRISGKHAGLASCGVALVALAASLPTLVELNIKENVRASVVVDTYKAWHKKQRVGRVPYTVDSSRRWRAWSPSHTNDESLRAASACAARPRYTPTT